jgi:hypothetical protein
MMTAPPKPQTPNEQAQVSDSGSASKAKRLPMDKHLKRQIANSNERKRMQSINAGFLSLRAQMPHVQGEKLSKASILQHAAEYIYRLHQEKTTLLTENTTLKVLATKHGILDQTTSMDVCPINVDTKVEKSTSPIIDPVCVDDEEFDDDKETSEELEQIYSAHEELQALRQQLDRERVAREVLEQENRILHGQVEALETSQQTSEVSRRNLDLMLKAIRQIEGDAFSRPTTPRDVLTPVKSGFTSPRSMVR